MAGLLGIGAGIAIGLTGLGVALAQAKVSSSAIEGVSRNPEAADKINSKLIICLGICESAAIYGLLIAGALAGIAFLKG